MQGLHLTADLYACQCAPLLMVDPDAFFQSKPPVTSSAPLGADLRPPTPHELRTGTLSAAAPANPNAASMFRRDSCGDWKSCRLIAGSPFVTPGSGRP